MVCVPLASLALTGCIIPEAPDYGAPRQTPIFIEEASISPNPRSLLSKNENAIDPNISFAFTVRSEDAGDSLYAVLYADYKHTGGFRIDYRPYDPLTFDEERSISLTLSLNDLRLKRPACHAITLMVVHEKGYDINTGNPIGAPADLASVTWFLSIETDNDPPPDLESCPSVASELSK